jgi:hypothetical protein
VAIVRLAIFLIILANFVLPSFATGYPDGDLIGVYFDTNADTNSDFIGASVPFFAYVIIVYPTSGVWGAEFSFCAVVPEGEETSLFKLYEEWPVMCPGPIDTEFRDYCSVGISNECAEEIPQINDIVIVAKFQFMLLKCMCVDFFLGPVVEQSIDDGLPAYVGDDGVVFPLALSRGAGVPVAIVNGGCGTVPSESISFDRVKCLYR